MSPILTPSLPDATAVPHADDSAARMTDDGSQPPPRQCGRCRLMFPGDPTLHPTALPDWWLCPPCRAALLGGPRRIPAPTCGP
jgi:hypothetical protein